MSWELLLAKSARKNITRFPRKDQLRIREILYDLIINHYSGDIEKIKGEKNTWRRRVGNYRILYEINSKAKIIFIADIRRRTSKTY